MKKIFNNKNDGISLLEILISLAIFSIILIFVVSFFFTMSASNFKTKADRENLESIRRVLDEMAFEIKSAKSIYTPTTTANQLSLETARYLPPNETSTFIDFFLCGNAICLKKEFQDPIVLTTDSVKITNIIFLRILNGSTPSIKINLILIHAGATGSFNMGSSDIIYQVDLTSTAASRLESALIEENFTMGWVRSGISVFGNWDTAASDADGSNLIAGLYGGRIYISSNYGATWTETRPAGDSNQWW
ncbi:MAG: type II secretion system protein, partial [Patescibacteria group bacterium]